MLPRRVIDRINALARKQRSAGLTPEEQAEQAELRRLYVAYIKEQVQAQLERRFPRRRTDHGRCHHDHA